MVGDLYEQDFAASASAPRPPSDAGLPRHALRGRVTYIDPRVDPQARTAKVRVEVPNPEGGFGWGCS